jgi:hypothetical protein
VVFVGENDRIMTWNGTGVGVAPLSGGKSHDFYGVWGSSPDDVWIVGNPAAIVHAQRLF